MGGRAGGGSGRRLTRAAVDRDAFALRLAIARGAIDPRGPVARRLAAQIRDRRERLERRRREES